jgi:hypothetical protein
MPQCSLPSTPALVCRRAFEPSRLQQQLLSEAYGQIVPAARRRRRAKAIESTASRSAESNPMSPVSPVSCGGYCA